MKFKNTAVRSGYTEIVIAGVTERLGATGIHRICPKEADIIDAISVAERDGFKRIYLHTTKPLGMALKLRRVLK